MNHPSRVWASLGRGSSKGKDSVVTNGNKHRDGLNLSVFCSYQARVVVVGFLFFLFFFFKDLFIICKYTAAVFRHTRRGRQFSLQMVVSHHVVAGN